MQVPHFVLYVKQLLADQFGKTIDSHGLKVITTIDYDKQVAAEKLLRKCEKIRKQYNATMPPW